MGARTSAATNRFTSNGPFGEACLLHEPAQGLGDTVGSLPFEQARHAGPGHEHEVVVPRDLRVERPECLSQRSLHRIPLYGSADLAAHRDPQARVVLVGLTLAPRERVE